MSYAFLTTRRDGPVEHLTLNRPDARNAFNEHVIADLTAWAAQARDRAVRREIRVVVISPLAIAKIGRSAARELFLTGARFSAARAKEIGLVHAVVPAADLDAAVGRYVRELLAAGPEAVAAAKALIAAVWGRGAKDAMPMTAAAIAARRVSKEGQEGLKAFLEKREPEWIKDTKG